MNIFLNINQMIFANLHVGHAVEYFDSKLKGILIGLWNRVFILDLKVFILQLRVVSNLVLNLASKRNAILLVKEWNYLTFSKYIDSQLDNSLKNLVIYESKWFGGLLSNYKTVFFGRKLKNYNLRYLEECKRFPAIMCLFNSNLSYWALLEGYNLKIPTVSLIDSDSSHFKLINYPIIASNKNINGSLLYLSVICNSIKYGRRKEIGRVLRFSNYEQKGSTALLRARKIELFLKYNYLSRSYKFWLFRKFVKHGWNYCEIL